MIDLIAYNIRKIREIKGFTQEYVAGKLGVSQNAYSKLERGEIKVDEEKLNTIAAIFEVNKETIRNYSDQIVFNNCSNSGNGNFGGENNTFVFNALEKMQKVYEDLLSEKEMRIKLLEDQLKSKQ